MIELISSVLSGGEALVADHPYLPVVVLIGAGLAVGLGAILFGYLLRPSNPSPAKAAPYECGNLPQDPGGGRFPLGFYRIAVFFLLLDVEAALLYPWAVKAGGGSIRYLIEAIVFLVVVGAGYIYIWAKGGLEWSRD